MTKISHSEKSDIVTAVKRISSGTTEPDVSHDADWHYHQFILPLFDQVNMSYRLHKFPPRCVPGVMYEWVNM
jgi:hypothetical protein